MEEPKPLSTSLKIDGPGHDKVDSGLHDVAVPGSSDCDQSESSFEDVKGYLKDFHSSGFQFSSSRFTMNR